MKINGCTRSILDFIPGIRVGRQKEGISPISPNRRKQQKKRNQVKKGDNLRPSRADE